MKPKTFLLFILTIFLIAVAGGCVEDNKDDYKEVSELIANRNQSRIGKKAARSGSPSSAKKKPVPSSSLVKEPVQEKENDNPKEEIYSIVLYEEEVSILSKNSGKTLAKGIAYINKQGHIIRLKIIND